MVNQYRQMDLYSRERHAPISVWISCNGAVADNNIAQVREAVRHDTDAVHYGDDWGQQKELIMGKPMWNAFIRPQLERMYGAVHDAGKFVKIHSCGQAPELFDDLLELGREGGCIFGPGHAVQSDVPIDNILAAIDEAHAQRDRAGGMS